MLPFNYSVCVRLMWNFNVVVIMVWTLLSVTVIIYLSRDRDYFPFICIAWFGVFLMILRYACFDAWDAKTKKTKSIRTGAIISPLYPLVFIAAVVLNWYCH